MKTLITLALAAVLAFAGPALAGEGAVYVTAEKAGAAWLYRVDRDTGVRTSIGSTGFASVDAMDFDGANRLFAMAHRASDGQLVFAEFDLSSGAGREVASIAGFESVMGMAYVPSTQRFFLYDDWEDMWEIEPSTGSAQYRGPGSNGGRLASTPGGFRYLVMSGYLWEASNPNVPSFVDQLSVREGSTVWPILSAYGMDCDPVTGTLHANVLVREPNLSGTFVAYVTIDPTTANAEFVSIFGSRGALAISVNRAPVIAFGPAATPERAPQSSPTAEFSVSVSDPDGNDVTCDWDFGDGSTGTGNPVSHTFAAPGAYDVRVTASDGSLSDWALLTFVVNSPPYVVRVNVEPWAVAPGEQASFSMVWGEPDDDPVEITWDFADGSSASGSSATHSYESAGVYAATVTLDDGVDPHAEPFRVVVGQEATKTKVRGKLNFKKPSKDSASLKCGVVLPDGFDPDGKSVEVDIGGVTHTFTLSRKGKAKDTAGKVSLKHKKKKGYWQLSVALKKGDFGEAWSDDGLTNADQKKAEVDLRTVVVIDGTPCFATTFHRYTARSGKWGRLTAR